MYAWQGLSGLDVEARSNAENEAVHGGKYDDGEKVQEGNGDTNELKA